MTPLQATTARRLSRQAAARRAAFTLGAFALMITGLWSAVVPHAEPGSEISMAFGAVRLLSAAPLIAVSVWLTSNTRRIPTRVAAACAMTTGTVAAWLVFEGLSSLYGETAFNDAVEVALNVLMTLGFVLIAVQWERHLARQRDLQRLHFEVDTLTGLPNRKGVARQYQSLPAGTPAVVVMFDLNDLTFVNEAGGHGAGDTHITATAHAIHHVLPEAALVGRWGGDEFVAVLPNVTMHEADRFVHAAIIQAPWPRPSMPPFAYGSATITTGEPLERALALTTQRMHERKALDHDGEASTTGESGTVTLEEFTKRLELLDRPEEVLEIGLTLARDLLNFEGTSYYEWRNGTFVMTEFKGPSGFGLTALQAVDRQDAQPGLVELAATTGNTVWASDYPAHPSALPNWVEFGLKSVVVTPVRCRGQTSGVLGLTSYSTWRAVTPQVRRLLEAVALRLGHTLERLQVIEDMRVTLEGGMLGLGLALEARDLETAGHTERVVSLADRLGSRLGLDEVQLSKLRQGAYLHDIGKLAIPDAVLLKPGRLDQAEWSLMQTHAPRGAELAGRIPTLARGALHVIRHHHERWDGHGYPDQLAGEGIPLLARIFAVCDVYDALTSERPYKRAWTHAEALAEIAAQSGRQFDPGVVNAFLALTRDADLVELDVLTTD